MLGFLLRFTAIFDAKLLVKLLILQSGFGLVRDTTVSAAEPAQIGVLTNCWNGGSVVIPSAYTAYDPSLMVQSDILDADNIAKFTVTDPQNCDKLVKAIQDAYASRPLMKQIFSTVLGLKHSVTFSIDPQIAPASGRTYRNSGSVILAYFKPFPSNTKNMKQADIVYHAAALIRHEVTHVFNEMHLRHHQEKFSSPDLFVTIFAEYHAAIEKIETIEQLLEADKNNPKLQEYKALANKGTIAETASLDQLRLLISQKNALKTMITPILKEYAQTHPKHVADEMFAHIFHLFSEGHIQNFFQYFYQEMSLRVESFALHDLSLHNAPLQTEADLQSFNEKFLIEKDNQHLEQQKKDMHATILKVFPYYREMLIYSEAYFENRNIDKTKIAREIIAFYTQPGIHSAINELSHASTCAQARRTLALAYHAIGDYRASYKHFNLALKKAGEHLFTDAQLYIFSKVADESNKVINCSAARKRAQKLQPSPSLKKAGLV